MSGQSIFSSTPCNVTVAVLQNNQQASLGSMTFGSTATFADSARSGETVTVAVDGNGVVTLSRPTGWDTPFATAGDGYLVIVTPVTQPATTEQVWMQGFAFDTVAFGGGSAWPLVTLDDFDNDPGAYSNGTADGTGKITGGNFTMPLSGPCSPDPLPASAITAAVSYAVQARITGAS